MSPYRQAYVVTMENGAVCLVVVADFNSRDGMALAKEQAAKAEQCAAWDACAFPTTDALAYGVRRLFVA